MGIVSPEPWIQARLDEAIAPLRAQLAAASTRRDRRRIRRLIHQAEQSLGRRLRRQLGKHGVAW